MVHYQEFLKQSEELKQKSKPTSTSTSVPSTSGGDACKKQQKMSGFLKQEEMPAQGKEAKTISTKIARMIAMCHLPYRFVEEKGFVELIQHLKPTYHIPVSTTFSRQIVPDLYNSERQKLQLLLKEDLIDKASADSPKNVALTTDNWTSKAGDSYMSLTCHYTTDFDCKSVTLGNIVVEESHTGENLRQRLCEMTKSWCLPPPDEQSPIKIFIVTDNASNLKAAISGTNYIHRFCFAHTLQLAISDAKTATPGVKQVISKARKIVGHYNKSSAARSRLCRVQDTMQLPKLKLIQDIETRWCSEYAMLERLLLLRGAIAAELSSSSTDTDTLSSTEWRLVEGVVEIMKPFAEATRESSGNSYPTASMIIPMIHCLKAATSNFVRQNDHTPGITFARNLIMTLNSRFPLYKTDDVNALCTIVDPRYKAALFEDGNERQHAISMLNKALSTSTFVDEQQLDSTNEVQTESTGSLWDELDKLPLSSQPQVNESSSKMKAIESYLAAPRLPRRCNPHEWWTHNKHHHPAIAKIADNYLSLPATQVASERVFSTAGNIVTRRRELLLPQHVDELTFLHDNLK